MYYHSLEVCEVGANGVFVVAEGEILFDQDTCSTAASVSYTEFIIA